MNGLISKNMWKILLRTCGTVLTLLALFYVAWSLSQTGALASPTWSEPRLWLAIALASVLYSGALTLIGYGWVGLVTNTSDVPLLNHQGLAAYSRSHLYKYLPTNVLHYVGRQVLLSRRGVSHAAIAWGSLVETLLMVVAAVVVAGLFSAPLLGRALSIITPPPLILTTAVGAIALLALSLAIFWRSHLREILRQLTQRQSYWAVVRAFVLCVVFFLLSGAALWITIRWGCRADSNFSTVAAVGAASWALGFLMPGASAGIGVREASIIAGLGAAGLPNEKAVLVAVAYRVATTAGDLLFAGMGFLLERYYSTPRSRSGG